jgi:N-methylhydantoinase A/oxoprolinase/acetone carboxylase beta subunit
MSQPFPSVETGTLVIGIDTGGTYTDGVLLDYYSRHVLRSCKRLTTRHNLSVGIDAVLEGLHIEEPSAIKMVSVSTTLATNAIVEGKGKRVALLLIGYDPDLVSSFKLAGRFATPHYFYFNGGHDLYGQEKEPLDLAAILAKVNELHDRVDALAISAYFSPLNPSHELQTHEAIAEICTLPVVLGHQLSTRLGSVERATTAALNASLLANLQDFITAVEHSLAQRQITAPLMVVRGDGTLMNAAFAARSPVETIHSGPAASAIGGRFLSGHNDALVVDIGGTSTDIALIRDGQVAVSETGATVGDYKTSISAANLLSIALGGDSHITATPNNKGVQLGPERVTPLSALAVKHPLILRQLKSLAKRTWQSAGADWLEYWYLARPNAAATRPTVATTQQRALIELLAQGPQPVPQVLKALNVLHVAQTGADALFRQEIIDKAGFTPTDLLHIEGKFTVWNSEAAALALDTFSRVLFVEPAWIHQQVWATMTETIVEAILLFLSEKKLPPLTLPKDRDFGRWFFKNSLYHVDSHLETNIRLRYPIIGIGAPAGILLPPVAQMLQTNLVLSDFYAVANAVGAVAGSVMVSEEILVYPRLESGALEVTGYYVQTGNGKLTFEHAHEAIEHARTVGQQRVLEAALLAGAENPQVIVSTEGEGLDTYRIRARAVGNPRLAY